MNLHGAKWGTVQSDLTARLKPRREPHRLVPINPLAALFTPDAARDGAQGEQGQSSVRTLSVL